MPSGGLAHEHDEWKNIEKPVYARQHVDRETHSHKRRQTDRDRQADRQTGRQADRQTGRRTDGQPDGQTYVNTRSLDG